LRSARDNLAITVILALAAGIAAALGVMGVAALAATVIALLALWLVVSNPANALKFGFFLLLIAQIKFRWRDPGAALSNSVDGQITFELAMYALVALVSILNLPAATRSPIKPSRNEEMLGLYVAFAVFSVFWSVAANITMVRATQLGILFLYNYCMVRRFGPTTVLKIFGLTLVFGVLLFAGMAVTLPFANGTRVSHDLADFSWEQGARFTWFAVQPINAGAQTGAAIIFLICCGAYAPGGWRSRLVNVRFRLFRLPLWSYIPPLVLVLAATRARGPLFATIAAMLVILLRRYVQMRLFSWVAVIAALVFILGALNSGSNSQSEQGNLGDNPGSVSKFLMRGQSASDFSSMSGRSGLWEAEEKLFAARPIIGYGYEASRGVLLEVLPWAGEAHNALCETALDLGLIGIVILWTPLIMSFFQSLLRRDPDHDDWTGAVISAFLAFMLIDGISEAGFTGVVSFLPIVFFAAMFAHRGDAGEAVRGLTRRPPAYEPYRAESGQRAWAFQRPTGGTF
jgi:O-antigen ligase